MDLMGDVQYLTSCGQVGQAENIHTDSRNRKHVLREGLKTLHNKITFYLQKKLGERPHLRLIISDKQSRKNNSLVPE
jgi:hypothetical protein